jgi:hypothetical protein
MNMYTYQHSDGWFRLALYTSQRDKFSAVLANKQALAAYDAPYNSQAAAERARAWITEQIGIAF